MSGLDGFAWRTYEDRLAEVLDGRRAGDLTGSDIIALAPSMHTGWGLAPLGCFPLMKTLNLVSTPHDLFPAQSRWVHPNTHTFTEEGPLENSTRGQDNFVLHVFAADRHQPFAARMTFAVVRKDIQRRGPGRFSPLYDPSSGQTTNDPSMFTHSGEALWSMESRTEKEFYEALEQPLYWLAHREICDTLAALSVRAPRQ